MVLLLVFMQLTRDLFAIAKFLFFMVAENIRYMADQQLDTPALTSSTARTQPYSCCCKSRVNDTAAHNKSGFDLIARELVGVALHELAANAHAAGVSVMNVRCAVMTIALIQ